MPNWFNISDISDLREGDIIEVPSKIPRTARFMPGTIIPIVKHYAMIVLVDDGFGNQKLSVAHNTFLGAPHVDDLTVITDERPIERVLRTNISSKDILQKLEEKKDCPYNPISWNCEDFVRTLCGNCYIGLDQRIGYGTILGVIIIILLLILIFRRR